MDEKGLIKYELVFFFLVRPGMLNSGVGQREVST